MTELNYTVRQYRPEDEDAILQICADTGFLGEPVDKIFSDREIFVSLVRGYYLAKEPEHTFVAEVDGEVVGYITGSLNQHISFSMFSHGIVPVILAILKLLTGRYRKSPQNKKFIWWILAKALWQIPKTPKHAVHAHFNIKKGYRHSGIGNALIKTALIQLSPKLLEKKINTLYGIVFAHSGKTIEYFKKAGFTIYDTKKSEMHGIPGVQAVCITAKISDLLARKNRKNSKQSQTQSSQDYDQNPQNPNQKFLSQ